MARRNDLAPLAEVSFLRQSRRNLLPASITVCAPARMSVALRCEMAATTGVLPMAGIRMSGSLLIWGAQDFALESRKPRMGPYLPRREGNRGSDRSCQHYIARRLTPGAVKDGGAG